MLCPQVVALQHPWGEKIPVFWKIPGIGTKIRNFLDLHFILWHLMIHQMGSIHHKRATPSAADPWRFRSAWNSVHQLTLVQVCNSSLWLAFLSFHHGNKSSNMYLIINLIFHLWLMTHTHHLPESTFFWVHRSWESLNHCGSSHRGTGCGYQSCQIQTFPRSATPKHHATEGRTGPKACGCLCWTDKKL